MKKHIALCLAFVLTIALSGCVSKEYDEAVAAFTSGDYKAALEQFQNMSEYKDAQSYINKAKDAIEYEKAKELMKNGEFSEACELFTKLGDYEQSEQMAEEARKKIAEAYAESVKPKIDEFVEALDENNISAIINEYTNEVPELSAETVSELNDYVVSAFEVYLKEPALEAYTALGEIIENTGVDAALQNVSGELQQVQENIGKLVAKEYLGGTWIRDDESPFNGLKLQVLVTDVRSVGIVLEDMEHDGYYYKANDIKWDEITITGDATFTLVEFPAGNKEISSRDPIACEGTIDYQNGRITIRVTDESSSLFGTECSWVRA